MERVRRPSQARHREARSCGRSARSSATNASSRSCCSRPRPSSATRTPRRSWVRCADARRTAAFGHGADDDGVEAPRRFDPIDVHVIDDDRAHLRRVERIFVKDTRRGTTRARHGARHTPVVARSKRRGVGETGFRCRRIERRSPSAREKDREKGPRDTHRRRA